jgi:hypothetical protein
MKSHYCHEEKAIIEFTGQCNWCGEKEMNANELVDELDKSRQEPFTSEYLVGQAATMLRQQQAEIEALKQIIDANNLSQNIGQFVKPAKTLTDEEIEECFEESCTDFKLLENGKTKGVVNIIDVGRAILRKAQEK